MNITVVGAGYVGLSNAIILSQYNNVIIYDILEEKIDLINNKESTIFATDMDKYLQNTSLNLTATTDMYKAYKNAQYMIIATPTNYDEKTNCFDTKIIDDVVKNGLLINPKAIMVIKSTVPIGYTKEIKKKYKTDNIIFSPEFLREDKALYDNLYPSRIIVGEKSKRAETYASLLIQGAKRTDIPILYTDSSEAEAIKLFSNTYLAMRIAYFNELDSFAELNGLDSKSIIEGVCLDSRIGDYYNNPSFGYGGYCLPKDTKQLVTNFNNVPQNIISAIVEANKTRKCHIAEMIINRKPNMVGIYRLSMKMNSDNFRDSAIFGIISRLKEEKIEIVIYEPTIMTDSFNNFKVIKELDEFIRISDLIVANRLSDEIKKAKNKVYTRDLYSRD